MLCCVCYFLLLIPLYYLIRYFRELLKVTNLSEKVVFITGCDSGFGRSLALKCAQQGMTVFAGCLTKEGEQSLKNEGGQACASSIRTVHLDITSQESVEKAVVFTEMQLSGSLQLWALVNNAGFLALYGPDDWCSIEDYEHSLRVNTLGHIRVIHAFRHLLERSKGRIITVTGAAGRLATTGTAAYSVSQFATEAYMNALRCEVHPFGITCSTIELGTFRTDFIDSASINARLNSSWEKLTHKKKAKYGEDYKNMCGCPFDLFATATVMEEKEVTSPAYIAAVDRKIQKKSSPCLDRVIACYYHAITARYPRLRYRCGCDAHFFVALTYLPAPIADSIVLALCKTSVVPAILANDKKEQ